MAAAEPEEIEAIVKPCGLGRSKARDISACMRVLRGKYNCKVPTTFEELLALPGVGRKSANLIMGDVFCKPAIVTDTHCIRLCNKIGLVDGNAGFQRPIRPMDTEGKKQYRLRAVQADAISKDVRYLNQAKAVWDYLSQYGWDNTCGGGVHWKELNEPSKSKHTCSTAPTGVLSCKLYQLTHEQKYLDKAIECFNWLQAYMQDPSDHLYYDNVSPDPEDPTQPGRMETNKYSYNSGQPLQLACLLYKITKNESYLTAAHQIAEACHKKWFTSYHSEVLQRDFNILAPGHAWFNTVMCRGFFELYSIDKNPSYLEDVRNTMLHAWFGKAHHISGLINDEDLSGAVSMNKWEILRQASLVELYALLAIWESGKDQTVLL